MIKKLSFVLGIVIVCALLGFSLAYIPICFFTFGKLTFEKIIFQNSTFWTLGIFIIIVLIGANVIIAVKYKFFSSKKLMTSNDRTVSNLYDNQCFMTKEELYRTYGNYDYKNLHNEPSAHGYVVNSHIYKNKLFLSMVPNAHGMLIGTTGTGKSLYQAGVTIQANAKSKEKPSMIINDLAGELYLKHSKHLIDSGYEVSVINLRYPRQTLARYNPCSIIWDTYHEYLKNPTAFDLLDRVAVYINELSLVICPEGRGQDANWANGARGILIGCFWGMLEDSIVPEFEFTRYMFTITQISNIVNRQKKYLLDFLFNRPSDSRVFDYAGTINDNESEKTVASYISHLVSSLTLFLENGMQYITSDTDINLAEISIKPTALFIIVPAETPTRSIIGTMIYTQLYNYFVFQATHNGIGALERTVYFILDEFGNLPKIKDFTNWLTTSRKMKIFFLIMLQSTEQLDEIYGKEKAKTICDNCHLQMYLGASSDTTIDYFQKKFGTYTAIQRNMSLDTSNTNVTDFKGQTNLAKKDLVTKSELQQIKQGEMYSYILRQKPMHTHLLPIFDKQMQSILKLGSDSAAPINKTYSNTIYDLEKRQALISTKDVPVEEFDEEEKRGVPFNEEEETFGNTLKFLKS